MDEAKLLLAVVYVVCFPMSIAAMEFAVRGGGNRLFCRSVQGVLTVLAAASAAGLHNLGKF